MKEPYKNGTIINSIKHGGLGSGVGTHNALFAKGHLLGVIWMESRISNGTTKQLQNRSDHSYMSTGDNESVCT